MHETPRERSIKNNILVAKLHRAEEDTGLDDTSELRTGMMDRDIWRNYVSLARTGVRPN